MRAVPAPGVPAALARTKITAGGLRAGTRVRVLFEDRALTAGEGSFVGDFRGRDPTSDSVGARCSATATPGGPALYEIG